MPECGEPTVLGGYERPCQLLPGHPGPHLRKPVPLSEMHGHLSELQGADDAFLALTQLTEELGLYDDYRQKPAEAEIRRSPKSPRWDLLGRYKVWVGGRLLLSRLRVVQCPLFAVLLTRIHSRDTDRDPHNHSRSFITICLTGSYDECLHDPGDLDHHQHRHHFQLIPYYVSHRQPHHISHLYGSVRTLVLAGRWHGPFWFFTRDGRVDYREYRTKN